MTEKRLEKVRNYQEYMRRSQTPEVMAGVTAILGALQAAHEYTAVVQDDLLPAQKKSLIGIQKKLKPELLNLSKVEDADEVYSEVVSGLIDAIEHAQEVLTDYYRIREQKFKENA